MTTPAPTDPYPAAYNPAKGKRNPKHDLVWNKPEEFGELRCNSCGASMPVHDTDCHTISVRVGEMFNSQTFLQMRCCGKCYDALFPWQ
jgi:hypothetical protein